MLRRNLDDDLCLTDKESLLFPSRKKYSILMVTDFSVPKFGGVETHGYQLAQCLIERGHKVTILSNKFNSERSGVRTFVNGVKIYHLPYIPALNGVNSFFTLWHAIPVMRQIMIKEHIDIVHGHLSTSVIQLSAF